MAETRKSTTTGTTRKKSTTKKNSAQGKGQTKSRAKGSAKGAKGKKQEPDSSFLLTEFAVLFTFAVAVLLFLSNFHLCGKVGEWLRQGILGTFGSLGFLLPILLFCGICFWISNRGNSRAIAKLAGVALIFCLLCGVCELIGNKGFDESRKFMDYFQASGKVLGLSGGLVGGGLCLLLCPTFGVIGAYLLLFVLLIGSTVFVTGRSFVNVVKKGSDKAYAAAREDYERRREIHAERREEKRRYRAEKKVTGMAMSIMSEGIQPSNEKKEEAARPDPAKAEAYDGGDAPSPQAGRREEGKVEKSADIFVGKIQMPVIYEEPEEKTEDGQTIYIKKDTRTLDEIVGEELMPPFETEPEPEPAKEEGYLDDDESDGVRDYLDLGGDFDSDEGFLDVDDDFIDDADDGFAKSMVTDGELVITEGTKTVVTASGKVIEVDTELTKKRLENRKNEDQPDDQRPGEGQPGKNRPIENRPVTSSGKNFSVGVSPGQAAQPGSASQSGAGGIAAAPAVQKPPKEYIIPPLDLLTKGTKKSAANMDVELKETAIKLQQTLQNFGVGVTVTNISCGPSVTRYELHPEQGVKVSKIVSLADDIKLNLAAADIRIEAPIPGKAAVGIEAPNKENNVVLLRDLLEAEEFKKFPSKLSFAVGKDIAGQTVVADIAKMPHLLIAGATGSGKSVCINTLIMSIIFKSKPEDVKLIMIDPKVVELSVYNGIPHLMIPVVTDPKKASGALNWAVAEMMDRYKKFAEYNVRDLKGYNEKVSNMEEESKPATLPQIVIIVDELADLMMVAPGEVEDAICRLAQLARAAGIHLVIATQRPSVNVITGLIKANVPSRIAFSVSSGVDSRTIIDMNGAEKLLGKGDMLFYPSGYQKPKRVQGAFVSDKEVAKVVDFLIEQGMTAEYSPEVEAQVNSPAAPGGGEEDGRDEYFERAGRFLIEKDKASIGMLQRAFKIGFNRAARIMDQLAEAGVVGEEEGTKPRKILMTLEEFDQYMSA